MKINLKQNYTGTVRRKDGAGGLWKKDGSVKFEEKI
jgi:hypothetical protein